MALAPDRGLGTVAGDDARRVAQREKTRADRRDLLVVVAAPEIGAADTAGEQRVAREEDRGAAAEMEAEAPRRVARGVQHLEVYVPRAHAVALVDMLVDPRPRRRRPQPQQLGLDAQVVV